MTPELEFVWSEDGDTLYVTAESLRKLVEDIVNSDGGAAIDKILELDNTLYNAG